LGGSVSSRSPIPCGSGACPRCRRCGVSGTPRHRSSRTSSLLQARGMPATSRHREQGGAPPWSLLRTITEPVGARLARELGASVHQAHRVTVPREQVRSYRQLPIPLERGLPANWAARSQAGHLSTVGTVLARDAGGAVYQAHRVIVPREQVRSYRHAVCQLLRVIASKVERHPGATRWSEACPRIGRLGVSGTPRHRSSRTRWSATPVAPTDDHRTRWSEACPRIGRLVFKPNTYPLWERCLPAMQAVRCIRHTASSFLANKVERHPGRSYRRSPNPLERGLPANWAARCIRHTASPFLANKFAPTHDHLTRWSEACPRIGPLGASSTPRHRSSRTRWSATPVAPTDDHRTRWSEACPRIGQLGLKPITYPLWERWRCVREDAIAASRCS
jgi:hypothetical protein